MFCLSSAVLIYWILRVTLIPLNCQIEKVALRLVQSQIQPISNKIFYTSVISPSKKAANIIVGRTLDMIIVIASPKDMKEIAIKSVVLKEAPINPKRKSKNLVWLRFLLASTSLIQTDSHFNRERINPTDDSKEWYEESRKRWDGIAGFSVCAGWIRLLRCLTENKRKCW